MKNIIFLTLLAFVMSSCTYTVYDMNRGELKIPKKATYTVNYTTIIPNGTPAKIAYTDKDGKQQADEYPLGGRWEKVVEVPSGVEVKFHVDVRLPKTEPAGRLVTTIKVNGETVSEETQSGKKVLYRFGFKLP